MNDNSKKQQCLYASYDFFPRYSIPLIFDADFSEKRPAKPPFIGSGVLLQIHDKHFIVTAGHVVEKALRSKNVHTSISSRPHHFKLEICPDLVKYEYCKDENSEEPFKDFGFITVLPEQASTMQAKEKIFLNLRNVATTYKKDLISDRDYLIVCGFPYEGMAWNVVDKSFEFHDGTSKNVEDHQLSLSLLRFLTQAKLYNDNNNKASFRPSDLEQFIDVETITRNEAPNSLPKFPGVSGSGLWKLNFVGNEDWVPNKDIKLIGISYFKYPLSNEGSDNNFLRAARIEHHLRLIKDFYSQNKILVELIDKVLIPDR